MNTPYYTLAIDITIKGGRDDQDITIRLVKLVPFVPANGMTLELWHDDSETDEETYRLELVSVYYSFKDSMFVEEQEDHALLESYRDRSYKQADLKDLLDWYGRFGFTRVNYPTVQVR